MKILIADASRIPVTAYGGTERVIWYLGRALVRLGHEVTYLVHPGSSCDFARVVPLDPAKNIAAQIPPGTDVVHFNFVPTGLQHLTVPYVITMHGNSNDLRSFDQNTIFISENHARRYGSSCFVHNGLDWSDYAEPDFNTARTYFHFLGKAAWRVKNVVGAIETIKRTRREQLRVLGGVRFNFTMGIRLTFSPRIKFYGMVGGEQKNELLRHSKGLIFPVRWHEPFGLAIIESLYFGCPVFGTPYGSLPELVPAHVGFLSNRAADLANAIEQSERYSPQACHAYAREHFSAARMAAKYLEKYRQVLDGQPLNATVPVLQALQKEKFLEWTN
jgi:glycosyltransferase involved in cell wall biosynthesis